MARLKSAFKEAVNYANEKAEMLVSRQRQGAALNEKIWSRKWFKSISC